MREEPGETFAATVFERVPETLWERDASQAD
jgi:hypothetical protein